MQATLNGTIIAESDDTVSVAGYDYFARASVRMEMLSKAAKTASDLECPHGVQFYDVSKDGKTYKRAAWNYEAPLPKMEQVRDRFGFWEDVKVA